ncbi:MAG: DUF4097 domain-containing protein [Oscillospiraceae bacterium]|jgi:DUF4097 and DUF4098 domain-containing protein YvlB|nr:DUF4097 domain-containing protein [Oscillospiraceae bacterium]
MKRLLKNAWKLAGALMAAGLILLAIGWTLGARGGVYADAKGVHIDKNERVEISKRDIGEFTEISVSTASADVELVASDHYGIELSYNAQTAPEWRVQDGRLTVKAENKLVISLFSFNFEGNSIKIYYPENARLDSAQITSFSGAVRVSDAYIAKLQIKNASGAVTLRHLEGEELILGVISGRVTLSDSGMSFGRVEIDISSGDITAEGLASRGTKIHAVSGRVRLSGELLGETDVKCVSGDVSVGTTRGEGEYSYSLKAVSGDVRVDGQRQGNSASRQNASAENSIAVNTTSGRIDLGFTK